jgi:hypothetical protein
MGRRKSEARNLTLTEPSTALDVRPASGHIGAEVTGVDLSRPQLDAARDTILDWDNRATAHRGPRDIDHLDVDRCSTGHPHR